MNFEESSGWAPIWVGQGAGGDQEKKEGSLG